MFYSLTGKVVFMDTNSAAIDCGSVAFNCKATFNTLSKIGGVGETVTLYTYLNVREDALDMFGFYDKDELDCFKKLINVTGVGPKAALSILSFLTPSSLAAAVASGDSKAITKAQGIGPKIAQRVVLELKDKLKAYITNEANEKIAAVNKINAAGGAGEEAVEALQMLGYTKSDASAAVSSLDESQSVDNLIKQALKILARNI